MFHASKKALACLLVILSLLSFVFATFGWESYPQSYRWSFGNDSYLDFGSAMNFTEAPYQGFRHDSSMVVYWNLNGDSGSVAHDQSGNGNNLAIKGSATWIDGKYGKALSLDGNGYVETENFNMKNLTAITIAGWLNVAAGSGTFLEKGNLDDLLIFWGSDGRLSANIWISGTQRVADVTESLTGVGWKFVTVTWESGNPIRVYMDGVLKTQSASYGGTIDNQNSSLRLGSWKNGNNPLIGAVDDVRIFNRALSQFEVAELYLTNPGSQPNPVTFAKHYNFTEPLTNNTMLIHVDNPFSNTNTTVVVTCTKLFVDNALAFRSNGSAVVNVWTNLGRPMATTGAYVWNNQNFTSTVTLDSASTAELNWKTHNITAYDDVHSNISPGNVSVAHGASQIFMLNTSQGYRFDVEVDGVSQGQINSYSFTNVTEAHRIKVTSTQLFTINASAGSGGSINPSGVVVVDQGQLQRFNITANPGYHISEVLVDDASEDTSSYHLFSNIQANHTISVSFALNVYNITVLTDAHSSITPGNTSINHGGNQQFNITAESGYYVSHVYVDGEDQSSVNQYNLTDVQGNHTISVISAPLESTSEPPPATNSTSSSEPSHSTQDSDTSPQTPPSTETTQTAPSTIQTAFVAIAIIALMVLVVVAFKKRYVVISIVDEKPEGTQ